MTISCFNLSVYLVTDPLLCAARGVETTVKEAIAGGVTMVQLRDKAATDAELSPLAHALRKACSAAKVAFVMNDRLTLANEVGADALHIGQSDGSVAEIRAALHPKIRLGLSVDGLEQLNAADHSLLDYFGAGPLFATSTKPDHDPPIGFEGLRAICAASPLPVVAIGGVKRAHIANAISAGAAGVAVVSEICAAPDPYAAAAALADEMQRARANREDMQP